ncbi:transposase [Legionella sp.]|uniref:transposase n=1 Tax=Legionella sp. TaxID=459 RepID=UPI003C982DE0
MSKRTLRTYDKEFKLNSVQLFLESGRSYKEISAEMGIPSATLATWVESYKKEGLEAFPGKGYLKPSDLEVAQLRAYLVKMMSSSLLMKMKSPVKQKSTVNVLSKSLNQLQKINENN